MYALAPKSNPDFGRPGLRVSRSRAGNILTAATTRAGPKTHGAFMNKGHSDILDRYIAVFSKLADAVHVKRGNQLCETASQLFTQLDEVVRPMGS